MFVIRRTLRNIILICIPTSILPLAIFFASCSNGMGHVAAVSFLEEEQIVKQVYFDDIKIKEEINLIKNGPGVPLEIDFSPQKSEESIKIEILDKSVINFASDLSEQEIENITDFTTEGNLLYPLSVGETVIKVSAPSKNGNIYRTCRVIVEEYEPQLNLKILNNENFSCLKSGLKSDKTPEVYTACVSSCRNLSIADFYITNSDNIVIVENSLAINKGQDGTTFMFQFFISEGNSAKLKVCTNKQYANFLGEISSEEIILEASEFLSDINYNLVSEKGPTNQCGNNYVLSLGEQKYSDLMNSNGDYTYYDLIIDKNLYEIESISSNIEILETKEGFRIFPKHTGEAVVKILTTDGSNISKTLTFIVQEVDPKSYSIKINDRSFRFSQEELNCFIKSLGQKTFELGDEALKIEVEKFPIYSKEALNFEKTGSAIGVSVLETETSIILEISPKAVGMDTFVVKLFGQDFHEINFNVINPQFEIVLLTYEDDINCKTLGNSTTTLFNTETGTASIYIELKLLCEGKLVENAKFFIEASDKSVVLDNYCYNSTFIRFTTTGEFDILIQVLNMDIARTIKIVVSRDISLD